MTFHTVIEKIMPEVQSGSEKPFIIFRKEKYNWGYRFTKDNIGKIISSIDEVKMSDPFATEHCGKDFAYGSFPYVYDKVFIARLYAEYHAMPDDDANNIVYRVIVNFMEDNISHLSHKITNRLINFNKALEAIYKIVSFSPDENFDEDRISEIVAIIESTSKKYKENK